MAYYMYNIIFLQSIDFRKQIMDLHTKNEWNLCVFIGRTIVVRQIQVVFTYIYTHKLFCFLTALSPPSKTRCIQLLMLLLPPSHRIVLQHLLDLFSQVICSSQSRMDALNLALVFAPTLFLATKSVQKSCFKLYIFLY